MKIFGSCLRSFVEMVWKRSLRYQIRCGLERRAHNLFAYMQGVQLDTERKVEWSQSVRVDAKQQLILESTVPRHGAESGVV